MDFDAAIQAHANWATKLVAYSNGLSHERIDPGNAARDDQCALGQWLHGDGKQVMAGRYEYLELLRAHADFHRQAGSLLRLADSGEGARVRALLDDTQSPFRLCSNKVVSLLQSIKASLTKPPSGR